MPHISGPPIFSSTCIHTYVFTGGVVLVCVGSCPGGFVRGFCPGWFLSVPVVSEYICYNRNLNITFNFRFHMYENRIEKCDVTCPWTPPSVTNSHTFSDPLSPSRA